MNRFETPENLLDFVKANGNDDGWCNILNVVTTPGGLRNRRFADALVASGKLQRQADRPWVVRPVALRNAVNRTGRGAVIDVIENDVALIRSIENWGNPFEGNLSFIAVLDRQHREWDMLLDTAFANSYLNPLGWEIAPEPLWTGGTKACVVIRPIDSAKAE